jgi:hypothetical protein
MGSGFRVDDNGVAVDCADGDGGGRRMVGGAGTLRLDGQLPENLLFPPLRHHLKSMRLHHSPDASTFPGFEQKCFVYIKCFSERIINWNGF